MTDQIHESVPRVDSDGETAATEENERTRREDRQEKNRKEERKGEDRRGEDGGSGSSRTRLLLLAAVVLAVVALAAFLAWRRNAPLSRDWRRVRERSADGGGRGGTSE